MTTPVIIDAFVVVFLAAFTVYGAKRGLLRALAGLVIVVLALIGAGMVATTFSLPSVTVVSPLIDERITQKVENAIFEQLGTGETDIDSQQIRNILKQLGVDEETWDSMAEKIQESVTGTGGAVADAVTRAVVENLVHSVLYGVLYILAFILLMILLHVLAGALGLLTKLPGLHALNALCGALLGLIEGALLLFLAVWIGRRLGVSFETEMLAEAHILRIFTTHTPLSVLSFLL